MPISHDGSNPERGIYNGHGNVQIPIIIKYNTKIEKRLQDKYEVIRLVAL